MNMRKRMVVFGCMAGLALWQPAETFGAATCGGHGTRENMLVSTSWLGEHLKDKNLVVLAIGQKAEYDEAHIPGSVLLDPRDISTKPGETPLTLELPAIAQLTAVFSKLGVSNDSRIVLYITKDWLTPMARVYMTLDAMGLGAHASVLDGGMPAWKSEGRALVKEVPEVKPGNLQACPQSDVITDLNYVKNNLHQQGVRILDARAPEVYNGTNPRAGMPGGHIQGAGNVYYNHLIDESGKLKPVGALEEQFSAAGVKKGDRLVTYCFIGQQASALYFVSRYLGYDVRLYDGSWEEWTRHPELPTENPAAEKK
ncbi:MAG: sulfurtransferase [Acidobacteriia bacterium]|nr:sulfurtransferase [Terriglobia bacterium]